MKKENKILLLANLLEEVYTTNDELVWKEIFYIIDKLKEITDN